MRGAAKKKDAEKTMVDRIRAFQRTTPLNKRCADCTELGPTYVCLDFQTFVCQYCSGIHREFGHKIKGISLSAWTIPEVEKLENAGNAIAAETWMARWTRPDSEIPQSGDPERVRDFLRNKYVDKKWWRALSEKTETKVQPEPPVEANHNTSAPAAKVAKARPAPMEDLLGGDLLGDAVVESPVAAIPAAPASNSLLGLDLSAPAPAAGGSLLDACGITNSLVPMQAAVEPTNSPWTADFGSPQQSAAPPPAQAPQGNGLFGLDFSSPAAPAVQVASQSSNQSQGLFGLDFNSSAPAPAPSLQGLNFPCAAAPASTAGPAADTSATPGERLRQSLLNGGSELDKLFEQSRSPQEVLNTLDVPAADRFKALQTNLGSLFSDAQPTMQGQMQQPFGMQNMMMPQNTMQPLGNMLALPPVSHTGMMPNMMGGMSQSTMQPLGNMLALPPVSHTGFGGSMPPLNNFPALMPAAGDGFSSGGQMSNSSWWQAPASQSQGGYLPSPSLAPTAFAPPMGGPTSTPFPQFAGSQMGASSAPFSQFSGPQHVGMRPSSPQAQANTFGFKMPSSPTGNARIGSTPTSPQETSPPKECPFDDLLGAFHAKHPISGLSVLA